MSSFKNFQDRNKIRARTTDGGNSSFVTKGYNSTIITDGTTQLQAAVVNEQEKDSAYIYTLLKNPLAIGSMWAAKSLHFLITEEIVLIKDVTWHKYKAELCNFDVDGIWGRFIGPEEKYINVALKQEMAWFSQQKPLIILPAGTLAFQDIIVLKGRPWMVQEFDSISTPGITYYSLTPTTVSKNIAAENAGKDCYIVKYTSTYTIPDTPITHDDYIEVAANKNITVTTEDGVFQYDNNAIIVSARTATSVTFSIPFGVDAVTIKTKEAGATVTTTYRLVD